MFKNLHKNFHSTWHILGVFFLLLLISIGFVWRHHSSATTEDARVMTNVVPIASTASGIVTKINVVDNQHVKQGQLLFELNPVQLHTHMMRHKEKTESKLKPVKITSPVSGYISNFNLHKGAAVKSYNTLFGIIQPSPVWVIANFLETELVKIRPGQPCKIVVTMYPHHTFKGEVESIGYGISPDTETDLHHVLPTVSASNSWLRLSQRFPVRIRLKESNEKSYPLRVGSNARVKVYISG